MRGFVRIGFVMAGLMPSVAMAATSGLSPQAASPVAAVNRTSVVTGGNGNLSYKAWRSIVGVTSTATVAGGGDPIYQAPRPQYNGVASLIMNYGAGGSFICTGTLVSPTAIVTAAHCVSGGFGTAGPQTTTAYFSNSPNLDNVVYADPSSTGVQVSRIWVNPGYTGEVIDQNDIAVLRLSQAAPGWATIYGMDFDPFADGTGFNVAGYGGRSDTGGSIGANLGVGRLRQGDNIFDYAWGNPEFGGFFTSGFFGSADVTNSWVSDFDNGLAANDASCILAGLFTASGLGCNTGVGAREVGVAGGDSGGPQFINGRLASVTSYGLSFGTDFGDIDNALNSSFGEYSGYVPLYAHRNFIEFGINTVPEPQSWAMLITGFGFIGAVARRRRAAAAAA